jgi:hypothetical protein
MPKKLVAPAPNAPKEEHKKHAEEFLKLDEYKKKPAGYQDKNDEAKP